MQIKFIYLPYFVIMFVLFCTACSNGNIKAPKPHMYPKVIYPVKGAFSSFDTSTCNFNFLYPGYSKIVKDTFFFEGKPLNPCWFDIKMDSLNASLYCSYYAISKEKNLSSLINDAFNIAGKHNIKANYRKEILIQNKFGVKGVLFDIEGPVASPLQFYLTDEKKHFFRASLYFNSKVNPDSTAPILHFIRNDIDTLISTFNWK